MNPTNLPEQASRSIIGSFYSKVWRVNRHDLNHLSVKKYPTWARRVIHAERSRRKNNETDEPTAAEKKIVLDFGEGISVQLFQPSGNQQEPANIQQPQPSEKQQEPVDIQQPQPSENQQGSVNNQQSQPSEKPEGPVNDRQPLTSEKQQGAVNNQQTQPRKKKRGSVKKQQSQPSGKQQGPDNNQQSQPNEKQQGSVKNQRPQPSGKQQGSVNNQQSQPSEKQKGSINNRQPQLGKQQGSVNKQQSQPSDNQQEPVNDQQLSIEREKEEFDGKYLHTHVANEASYYIAYDETLCRDDIRILCKKKDIKNIPVWGHFVCKTKKCKGREWKSSVIATNLRFSKLGKSYKATLHAQQCSRCGNYAEPIVEVENYVERVISRLDRWMGVKRHTGDKEERKKSKRPHDMSRCHGCKVRECPYNGEEEEDERPEIFFRFLNSK
ncbi:hypothetical protein BX616_009076 [Lobosporangium transversale]|uniref:Zinc-binding domain-domain-containing protein n=1 Tax=Lobosporangium transversale TaxID=64571 RepID=A0A1Y2GD91_9FUNG|nr:zinc-binding domain-domain-containing protein [Lobosporangium transversale]KAF9914051.1 hypothetical protein BX616_009076 [Lobosporangium transversale]ORZ07549.1 zinc-binding domain-domain-containing protein [Lobosporangium transversale]|eukprot:XP_021878056.1 zinc-binding domain-domain-containing protein [Lobosporangium transversale]